MLRVEVAQTYCGDELRMCLGNLDQLNQNIQILLRRVLYMISLAEVHVHLRRAGTTHIIPMKLQQFHPATKPSRPLFHALKHEIRRHGTIQRPKNAPLRRSVHCFPDLSRQSTAEISVDELRVALRKYSSA